jgi:hypothetical protein
MYQIHCIHHSSGLQPGERVPPEYAKTSYINQNDTQEPLEPALILTLTKISPPIEVLACQKQAVISLTGQNHINH